MWLNYTNMLCILVDSLGMAEHALSAAYDLLTKDDVLTAIAEIGECG